MSLYTLFTKATSRRSLEPKQYTSLAFGKRCERAGVKPSMGSVGDCFDNALCESFFASLECELIDRCSFPNHRQARLEVFDFIEGFYNTRRRHSSLGQVSPMVFENNALESSRATRFRRTSLPPSAEDGDRPRTGAAL